MAGVASLVSQAQKVLGPDVLDVEVKTYIREKEPTVPEDQIGPALRKIRGAVVPANKKGKGR
jgi:hypothetical protein